MGDFDWAMVVAGSALFCFLFLLLLLLLWALLLLLVLALFLLISVCLVFVVPVLAQVSFQHKCGIFSYGYFVGQWAFFLCCMVFCHYGNCWLGDCLSCKWTPHLSVADNHRGRGAILVPRFMRFAMS